MALSKIEVAAVVLRLAGRIGAALDDDTVTAAELMAEIQPTLTDLLTQLAD